jgi:2-oxoglutarate ferredoxin oxidoreductase subunit gamma
VEKVVPGGLLIYERSTIISPPARTDIEVLNIPAVDEAHRLTSKLVANVVLLGAFLERRPIVKPENIILALRKVLPKHRQHLLPVNERALMRGKELAIEALAEPIAR